MFNRRFLIAVAFIAAVVSPPLLECSKTCQMAKQNGYVQSRCPVKLSTVPCLEPWGIYTECVTISVKMNSDDFCNTPRIEILSPIKKIIKPTMKKRKKNSCTKLNCGSQGAQSETRVRCGRTDMQQSSHSNVSFALCELVYDCIKAKADTVVSVSYNTTSTSCSVSYTVPDPIPDFNLSVDLSSKSINVSVESGDKVHTRWCYEKSAMHCIGGELSRQISIEPSQSQSALLNIPYLLPCVCVEVYYTHTDSCRHKKCPFENQTIADVADVWLSSKVTLFESKLTLGLVCPASNLKVSASLCWKQHEHLCIPVLNSTLEKEGEQRLIYNTSAMDKHPQMCVQFSLQGSRNISCPFLADMSSWEVYIGPGRQSVLLFLTSSVRAKFSAQLCVLNEKGCAPTGEVHSLTMDVHAAAETRMDVPVHFLAERPCVQVWQSDPYLHGRRILCPNYTHNRLGMYAVVALMFVVIAALLGVVIHRLTKSGAAGWLCIQNPVLLVCSSEQSAHISAVCALASILQGELSATVHMALWALSSQMQAGASAGVADLGPLPWLYGQWEAVRKAQGKVVIVWSPEAMKTYERWREERATMDKTKRHEKLPVGVEEDFQLNGRRLEKCKKEKVAGKKDCVKICDDDDWYPQREPSSVIAPVFMAALACLEGMLQGRKGQEVVLVYFQGLCQSRDIPKAFRGVPRYCLPQEFRGLIQELGGMQRQTKTGKLSWHCCPRLLSKVQSIWLARQLSERLQTLLPQMQGKKMQRPSGTLKMLADKTQSRLMLPPAANAVKPGTAQEHEPLHESPWKP